MPYSVFTGTSPLRKMGVLKRLKKAVFSRIKWKQRQSTAEEDPPNVSGANDAGSRADGQNQDATPVLAPTASPLSPNIAVSVERETTTHTEAGPELPNIAPPNLGPLDLEPVLEPPALEPPTVEPPTVEPPTVEPPTVEPPTVEPPTVEPPVLEPPTVEPSALEPPTVEPLPTNGPEEATTSQILDTQVDDVVPASDTAIVENAIHPGLRRDSATVHTSSVSTNKLSFSAFALLRQPTHLVGSAAVVTVPSNTPAEAPSSPPPSAPTTGPHTRPPPDSPRDSPPTASPAPAGDHAALAAEPNDQNVSVLHLNHSRGSTVLVEPDTAAPGFAGEDQVQDEPSARVGFFLDIGRTYNNLDPLFNVGRRMRLGAGVYTIEGFADRGTESTILIGHDPNTKEKRWLKVICKYDLYRRGDSKERSRMLLEKDIMQRVYNENIPGLVRSLGSWSDKYFVYHWMDCPIGTLGDAIKDLRPRDFVFNRYVTELLLGLTNLHDMGCIHRGISLESILVQADGSLTLGDLTEVCRYDPAAPPKEVSGFVGFMAPEVIAPGIFGSGNGGYDQAADVWSLGMVFLHMYLQTLDSPYGTAPEQIEYRTFAWDPRQLDVMIQMFNHDRLLYDLLCQMLVRDPTKRSTARRLLVHPYFEFMLLDLNNLNNTFPAGGRFPPVGGLPWERAKHIRREISRKAGEMILADEIERETRGDPFFFKPEVEPLNLGTISSMLPNV